MQRSKTICVSLGRCKADPAIEILQRHITFIIGIRQAIETSEVNEEIAEFLTLDSARQLVQGAVRKGEGLLSQSEDLWKLWLDWELSL